MSDIEQYEEVEAEERRRQREIERQIADLDGLTFAEELQHDTEGYRACRCEDYPCCGH